jgi:hypothetical protein
MSTHHNTIFISYRCSESQLHTLALYHRLQQEYRGQVFMDQQGLIDPANSCACSSGLTRMGDESSV